MTRFPWRFAVYFFAGLYLFADMIVWQGPLHRRLTQPWSGDEGSEGPGAHAATVYGRPITRLDLAEALRLHLWKRGEQWDSLGDSSRKMTRQTVLENLVNHRMLAAFRIMNGLDKKAPQELTQQEQTLFKRQFFSEEAFLSRLTMQARDPNQWQEETREAIETSLWIEEKIRHRLLEITEADALQWYHLNQERLTLPQRHRVAHLYLTRHDESKTDRAEEIDELYRRLTEGSTTFDALTFERSEDDRSRHRGGDLGWVSRQRMPADFMDAVEGLAINQLSPPVLTNLGWHLILVTERQPPRVPDFGEVQAEILAFLQNERRQVAIKVLIAELRRRSMTPTQFIHHYPEVIDTVEPSPR